MIRPKACSLRSTCVLKKGLKMTKKKEGLQKFGLFLLIMIASFLICYLPFFCTGKTFIWHIDGASQHYTFLTYLMNGSIFDKLGGIDLVGTLGSDSLISYIYYGLFDPFYCLMFLLPSSWSVAAYEMIVILKMMGIAIIMYWYLRHKQIDFWFACVLAIAYMLSGYSLTMTVRHPMLASGMMYLPLCIWGVENIIENKRPYLFLISNTLLLLSSFYMFFMVTLFSVIYVLCHIKSQNIKFFSKKFWLLVGKFACLYVIIFLILAFMLLPLAYGYTTSARGENKGFVMPTILVYWQLLTGFLALINAQQFFVLGLSLPFVLLLILGICFGKTSTYRTLTVVMLACMVIPFTGYIMNVGNYVSGRWLFLAIFTFVVESGLVLQSWKQKNYTLKQWSKVVQYGWILVVLFLTISSIVSFARILGGNHVHSGLQMIIYVLLGTIGILLSYLVATTKIKIKKIYTWWNVKFVANSILILTIVLGGLYNIYYLPMFHNIKTLQEVTTSLPEKWIVSKDFDHIFRVDEAIQDSKQYLGNYQNKGLINNYASTYSYNTISNSYVYEYLQSIGQAGYMHTLGMGGLQGRLAPNAILSTEYYITSNQDIPYGYDVVAEQEGIYQNSKYLPFGFVYEDSMSEEFYYSLPLQERANAMLQAAVVESKVGTFTYQNRANRTSYEYVTSNMSIQGNFLHADKNAQLTLTFAVEDDAETILLIKGLVPNHQNDTIDKVIMGNTLQSIQVKTDTKTYRQNLYEKGSQMYSGIQDFVFNLGNIEDRESVTISFSQGEYTFEDIAIYSYKIADYEKDIQAFTSYLDNVTIDNQTLTGNITSNGGILFLSMPYTKGWTAYVDGRPVEIEKVNIGYMGLHITEGTHTIKLTYETPYFAVGKVVSYVSLSLVVVLGTSVEVVVWIKKRRKHEKEPE